MYKLARSCTQVSGALSLIPVSLAVRHHSTAYNLVEVGKFTAPKTTGNYDCGQVSYHKLPKMGH